MPTNCFQTSRLVEFSDTDMAGIMHFAAFFRYMESAEHELIRSLGLSVYEEFEGTVISFPRVAAKCEYHSPARCEDQLDIAIVVRRLGNKSITYGFDISHNKTAIATGEITCVCCELLPNEPPQSVSIPATLRAKLELLVCKNE